MSTNTTTEGTPDVEPGTGHCIVCAAALPEPFLDLGRTALANKFLLPEEASADEPAYPLRLVLCGTCGHIQLADPVPPPAMFDDYLYVSSASDTLKQHLHGLARTITERRNLQEGDLVIDIGANDGTLLEGYAGTGVRRLGVDPAQNLADLVADKGIDRYVGYFNAETAQEIKERWGTAAVITATNTFPHIPRLHDFMRGIESVLAPGGAFIIEAHYVVDILDSLAFDTVYHEHVSFWTLGPMQRLFAEHGLQAVSAERLPIHHGQLRVTVQRIGEGEPDGSVQAVLDQERERGANDAATWDAFATRVRALKDDLRKTLAEIRAGGGRVAAYGAPAKGSTLLEYFELGTEDIDWIADRSPLKQGRVTPGSHIPIVAPDRILSEQPEALVLLAWNFADEVMRQQAEYVERGGRFIIPVPEVRTLP